MTAVFAATAARADLQPYKDYTLSQSVSDVTTVKVNANMQDAYLEGLQKTWVASMKVAKRLGQVEGYHIYVSDLPESGHFNMVLVVDYKNDAQLAPNKARYEAFMKAWGAKRNAETNAIAQKDYPAMRKITGEYHMRELTFTK
ncbi:MAG TPA: hypothetical protein VMU86_00750 [Steroidobacteraceae bacterium]|nr:hypothetical protein [Steroidobacteraceae bacterium]